MEASAAEGPLGCPRGAAAGGPLKTFRGWTPLHFAAYEGHTSCLQPLLSGRADPNAATVRLTEGQRGAGEASRQRRGRLTGASRGGLTWRAHVRAHVRGLWRAHVAHVGLTWLT